jgi:hypothetical protein
MTLAPHGNGFDSLFIHVVNETGQSLQRFDVVGLDEPLETKKVDLFCNHIIFKGIKPKQKHAGS